MSTDDSGSKNSDCQEEGDIHLCRGPLQYQNTLLPLATVSKIIEQTLPEHGKIANDAIEFIRECVTEFILFITSEASVTLVAHKAKKLFVMKIFSQLWRH